MGAILLVKSSQAVQAEVGKAVTKFLQIFGEKVLYDDASSISHAIGLMTMNSYSVVFIDKDLSQEDLNLFAGALPQLKVKPIIVTSPRNLELLKGVTGATRLMPAPHGLTKGFVFDHLRSALIKKDRKVDPRVFASILRGIMRVVDATCGLSLTPQPISATRSQLETNDVTAVCSFYGDGLQSSLVVSTSDMLVTTMASKAISLPPESISAELKIDFLMEVVNQLVGAVSVELEKFGYELTPTILFVAAGENHSHFSRTNGKYIVMPFTSQGQPFKVTFCYDAYSDFLQHAELSGENHYAKKYLDIRLVDGAIKSVSESVSANLGIECRHTGDKSLPIGNAKSELVSLVHGVGRGTSYTFLMRLKQEHARIMASKLLQTPPETIPMDMVVDSCGEILNQIAAKFHSHAGSQKYPFRKVFHSDISSASQVDYALRVQGKFLLLTFETEDFPFEISFGVDSIRTPALFDIHEWLDKNSSISDGRLAKSKVSTAF